MSTVGPRDVRRRHTKLVRWIGEQIRDRRLEVGLTQRHLAACANVDQGFLSKIESGTARASLAVLVALSTCLGADLGVRLFATAGPRIQDRFQAPMIEALIAILGPVWRARPEVPVPAARGIIDLVLSRALDRLTIACECHSELRRLELILRRAAEKSDGLRADVGTGSLVSSMLLLRSTRATRQLARAYEATLAAAYPARTADALAALAGSSAWPGPAILWASVENGRGAILDGPPRGVLLGR